MAADPRAKSAFDAAEQILAMPPEQRAHHVLKLSGEDLELARQTLDLVLASIEAGTEDPSEDAVAESKAPSEPLVGKVSNNVEPTPGERWIGSFRVVRELGRGGMGTVFLAEQLEPVRRLVAVKLALEPLGEEARVRLAIERQTLALLSHDNIARILEAGETEEGYPYFAMEFVDGPSVLSYCDQNQLDLKQRIELFLEVCSAVEHAHRNGILHRDLKPSNILIAGTEQDEPVASVPKVIDFGIAKGVDGPVVDLTLWTGDLVLGTPAYVAPEAIALHGEQGWRERPAPDTRADVYALGVVLQELLMGRRPLTESATDSAIIMLRRVVNEEPPALSARWRGLDEVDESAAGIGARHHP